MTANAKSPEEARATVAVPRRGARFAGTRGKAAARKRHETGARAAAPRTKLCVEMTDMDIAEVEYAKRVGKGKGVRAYHLWWSPRQRCTVSPNAFLRKIDAFFLV